MNVWWMEDGVSGVDGDTVLNLVVPASDPEAEHAVTLPLNMEAKTVLEPSWRRRNVSSRFVLQ